MNSKTCKDCPCYEPIKKDGAYASMVFHINAYHGVCMLNPPIHTGFERNNREESSREIIYEYPQVAEYWWCYRGREIMEKAK